MTDLFPRWVIVSVLLLLIIIGGWVLILGVMTRGTIGGLLTFGAMVTIGGSLITVFTALGNEWGYISPSSQRRRDDRLQRRQERRARYQAYRVLKETPPSHIDLRDAASVGSWHERERRDDE